MYSCCIVYCLIFRFFRFKTPAFRASKARWSHIWITICILALLSRRVFPVKERTLPINITAENLLLRNHMCQSAYQKSFGAQKTKGEEGGCSSGYSEAKVKVTLTCWTLFAVSMPDSERYSRKVESTRL